MSDTTARLALPFIMAAQAQKHVTHNEALRLLDGLVQMSVKDRELTAPPASPNDGDRYIVASGATGAWAGWDLNIALWTDGAWLRLPPRAGWRAWVEDEGLLLVYNGSACIGTTPAALQNMALFGLGTTSDAANPFSAKLNAALWTAKTVAEGGTGDLFYTMNKEAAGDDLGLTLQTGYVTKAFVGLFGSNKFRLAVSADGSSFFDGLMVDNANGIVHQPRCRASRAIPTMSPSTPGRRSASTTPIPTIRARSTPATTASSLPSPARISSAPRCSTRSIPARRLACAGGWVPNGATEIRGSRGEISGDHVSEATELWLQTMVALSAGDTVELQGTFRVADGYFAADRTCFWGAKVG
jgi:hypothetical protein